MSRYAILLLLSSSLLLGQRTPFQFAWLSDTHVGGTTGNEDLRACVKDINELSALGSQPSNQQGPQFVVLSGDITEYGSCEQLDVAKQILDSLTIPYYILPGNHDTKWSESGATYFPKIFKADRFVFDLNGIKFIGMHQGPLMKMGDGHWAPQDVRWIDSVLTHLSDPQQPIVFVTHYPLEDEIANWYEVLDRLKAVNTQVALVGHGHANRKMSFEGIPGVMGRSSLRARGSSGGFTIVDVRNDSLLFSERTTGVTTKPPWHRLPVVDRKTLSATPISVRPHFSVNEQYPNIQKRWKIETGYTIASTPAIWNDFAIVGNASGTVRALRLENGETVWTFHAKDAVYSTPAVGDDVVVFASADGCIYALDAATGTLRWRLETGRAIVASPVIDDGIVYIGASDKLFRAIELSTGKLKWVHQGIRGFVETKPLVYDGKIIFGAWDGFLYALNATDGTQCWRWAGDKPGALLSPAACWPIGAEDMVFVVAPDRRMTAIDAATGRQIWRTAAHQVRESIGLSEDGDRFYVRTMQDSILAFATEGSMPTMLWGINAGFGYDINSAMLVERDGVVYYGTKNGLIIAVDGETGQIKWKHRTGVALLNTVVPLGSGDLLVTDFDGNVMRIGE